MYPIVGLHLRSGTGLPVPRGAGTSYLATAALWRGRRHTSDLPFFPTASGTHVSAERLSASVAAVADRLGLPLVDNMGRVAFSEHVFRVSGSRMLARAGVPVETIKLFARWSTSVVDRYIGDAPLERHTDCFRCAPDGVNFVDAPLPVPAPRADCQAPAIMAAPTPALEAAMHGTQLRIDQLEAHLHLLSDEADPTFVRNHGSGVYHCRGTFGIRTTPSLWRTPCGWYFGTPLVEATWASVVSETSPDLICSTCLPELLLSLRDL